MCVRILCVYVCDYVCVQEAGICVTFGQHVQIPIEIRYLESSHQELSINICMGLIRERGGGSFRGGPSFLRGVSKIFLGHFYRISNILSESSA